MKTKEPQNKVELTINLSEEHKIILWLWRKCGTSHMAKIMNKYGFKFYRVDDGELVTLENNVVQKHYCNLFEGHENYKILAAVRNPYSRFFSEYTFNRDSKEFVINETTVQLRFDSAWNPPLYFYEHLEANHGFTVTASWFEGGMGFAGEFYDGEMQHYEWSNLEEAKEVIPDHIEEQYGIIADLEMWAEEDE